MTVKEYIENHWDECIKENMTGDDSLIGLPYPYTVPAVGFFDEMYYWDTYFTNKGLMLCGRYQQIKNNTDNMLYMVDRYGFMPNGNRVHYLGHSQPPFLSLMVRDVYDYYKDKVWLLGAYETLKKEYDFWLVKKGSDIGLSKYTGDEKFDAEGAAEGFEQRAGVSFDIDRAKLGKHFLSTAESGWDITPRWDFDAYNFAAVDLNSLLFAFESNMDYFAKELGREDNWSEKAEKRKQTMTEHMQNADGLLLDYNVETKKQSKIFSAASLYPLFAGLLSKEQAESVVSNLSRLEADYGILTCEKNDCPGTYQWDYPNGWACLQYVAIAGLDRYGYKEEAKRIAAKYVNLVEKVFAETGNLWEKYNVVEGNINVTNEYGLPPMMGWSAGVYLAADKYLCDNVII